jgi:hypothetical protein
MGGALVLRLAAEHLPHRLVLVAPAWAIVRDLIVGFAIT